MKSGKKGRRIVGAIILITVVLLFLSSIYARETMLPFDITEKIFADIDEMAFLTEFSARDIEDEDIHDLEYAEAFQKSIEYEGHCYSVLGYAFNDISTARAYLSLIHI